MPFAESLKATKMTIIRHQSFKKFNRKYNLLYNSSFMIN